MPYPNKQKIVAKAHENPEYAVMSARKLAPIIGVSQPVISMWRRKVKRAAALCAELQPKSKKATVTVESVRRKWEEKYAHLNRQYEALASRLIEMAKKADQHRNAQRALEKELDISNEAVKMLTAELYEKSKAEKKSWIQKLFSSKA